MSKLKKEFYNKNVIQLAKDLLGNTLVHETKEGLVKGKIVETEAYHENDPASHCFNGKTDRNKSMYKEGGTAYAYFTYGIHYCFNIVAGKKGVGTGVLIRSLEPIEGIEIMKKRRNMNKVKNLTNGPAKLTQAMGINMDKDGIDLTEDSLYVTKGDNNKFQINKSKRIGISKAKDKKLRFYIKGNPFVSKLRV